MDTNYNNFCANAILSQREVCCIADEMLEKCKENKLDIPLSEDGREVLAGVLSHFSYLVRSISFPKQLARYSTYVIDIFPDRIQFGFTAYAEDTKFDKFGYPCIEPVEELGNGDGEGAADEDPDYRYKPIFSIPIPTIPLKVWAEQNGVNRNTARTWVAQGRLKTFDDGGNECRISAIQYVPDAPYENKKIPIRFRNPGNLPEKVVKKYPSLAGEVFDILLTPVENRVCEISIVSRAESAGQLEAQTFAIREDERDAIIRALLSTGEIRSTLEQYYHPPVGDSISVDQYRFASIRLTAEDISRVEQLRVVSSCINDTDLASGYAAPNFSIKVYEDKGPLPICSIGGNALVSTHRPEESVMMALFDEHDLLECKNRVLAVVGGPQKGKAPWNQGILFLTKIEYAPDADLAAVATVVRNLPRSAERGFAFSPNLLIAPVPLDKPNLDSIIKLLTDCGFAEVQENENEPYEDYRVFYAYANP